MREAGFRKNYSFYYTILPKQHSIYITIRPTRQTLSPIMIPRSDLFLKDAHHGHDRYRPAAKPMIRRARLMINNEWVDASDSGTLRPHPATGETLATSPTPQRTWAVHGRRERGRGRWTPPIAGV